MTTTVSMQQLMKDILTWNYETVPGLARNIYENGRYDIYPILADALEAAFADTQGWCDWSEDYAKMVDFCRNRHNYPGISSYWPLELILGKKVYQTVRHLDWDRVVNFLGLETEYVATRATLDMRQPENTWLVVVPKGTTYNRVFQVLRTVLQAAPLQPGQTQRKDIYTYDEDLSALLADDIENNIRRNDRDPNRDGSYTTCFRALIEADPENQNQSWEQRRVLIDQGMVQDITLLECLLLVLAYFVTIGRHLDITTITLCAGSRHRYGDVPSVDWYPGHLKVHVYWYDVWDRDDSIRSRSVVSRS